MQRPDDTLLTVRDTAIRLKSAERTVQMLCECGRIRAFKIGRSWRVWESDLAAFIAEREDDDPQ